MVKIIQITDKANIHLDPLPSLSVFSLETTTRTGMVCYDAFLFVVVDVKFPSRREARDTKNSGCSLQISFR